MLQVLGVSLSCAAIIIYLKSINSDLILPATICSGIIVLSFSIDYLGNVFSFFSELKEITGIDGEFILIISKITAIGYLVEFAAGTIEDFGLKSLSDKLIFVGKIIILSISLPIIYSVINVIKVMLN